jgi:hypothetical protein
VLPNNEAVLKGVMYDNVVFSQPVKFDNNESNGIIPLEKLPPGLLHLTITSGDKIYASRPVIITKPDFHSELLFKKDTISFNSKAKNVVTIGLPDSTEGNFSVSVTAVDNTDIITGNNSITQSVMLASESASAGLNMQLLLTGREKKSAEDLITMTGQWITPATEKIKPVTDNRRYGL